MTSPGETGLDPYLKAVFGRKAQQVVALNVKELTSFADVFILCSGRSTRQTAAIADHVQRELKNIGIRPLSVEGQAAGHWILMDYGDVIIHIFYEDTRKFYNLEGLWADAGRIDIKAFETENDIQTVD